MSESYVLHIHILALYNVCKQWLPQQSSCHLHNFTHQCCTDPSQWPCIKSGETRVLRNLPWLQCL